MNWNRINNSPEDNFVFHKCFRAGLGFLLQLDDPAVREEYDSQANRLRFRWVITPIILNVLDAPANERGILVTRDEAADAFLNSKGADWHYLTKALYALKAVNAVNLEEVDSGNGFVVSTSALMRGDEKQEIPVDLDYSKPLDVHTWSEHSEVTALVDEIYERYFEGGNTQIKKKHLKVVLLDLFVNWKEDPNLKTAFARDVGAYKARSRYNALHISKTVIDVVDRLVVAGLVNQAKGFRDRGRGVGRVSRIWPTAALIEKFERAEFGPFDIDSHTNEECIILRDVVEIAKEKNEKSHRKRNQETVDVQYSDTDQTRQMRAELTRYNEFLSRTFIDIPSLELPFIKLRDHTGKVRRLSIGQNDKFVRRIFNRGSWEKGGRFWGGWWQRCPKEWRKKIFINDHPTNEIDYSGLHIVLLYGRKGIDYWSNIDVDPYAIPRPDFLPDDKATREVAKSLLLVAINAKNDKEAFKAFRSGAEPGSPEKRFTDAQLGVVLGSLREKHPTIAGDLSSDAGIDLMNVDSRITAIIIGDLMQKNIPVLTVHDSYIVPFGQESLLETAMKTAFKVVTGVSKVRMKEVTETFDQRMDKYEQIKWMFSYRNEAYLARQHMVEPYQVNRCRGYTQRMQLFDAWREKN